jgi:forkhead box protein N
MAHLSLDGEPLAEYYNIERSKNLGLPNSTSQSAETGIETKENGFPKPAYSYACLIALALKNSYTDSMSVSEIYKFICEHFPYFKNAPSEWKNSVRHTLCMNKCFEKSEKPASSGGQWRGWLWAMKPSEIKRMDNLVKKWTSKDIQAIKEAMAMPDCYDALERGEMKKDYNPNPEKLTKEKIEN